MQHERINTAGLALLAALLWAAHPAHAEDAEAPDTPEAQAPDAEAEDAREREETEGEEADADTADETEAAEAPELPGRADLEEAFAGAAEAVGPSVVSVTMVRTVQPARMGEPGPDGQAPPIPEELEEFLERFFGERPGDRRPEFRQRGMGSGVIIDTEGHILTNNHVIHAADELTVQLHNGQRYDARVVGADPQSDLAVIRIEADGDLEPARLGDSERLRVGQWVLALGSPFGLERTVTAGIVSATGRADIGVAAFEDFIQTDAAINVGNSGGPLVNLDGEVVGINTAILSRTGAYQGVGLAIPTAMAEGVAESLIRDGRVVRGWLGVYVQDLTPELAEAFGHDSTDGVLIPEVMGGGPADRAGLRPGDIVTQLDGESVADATPFRNRIAETRPGTEVELAIWREGEELSGVLEIGERPEPRAVAAERPEREPEPAEGDPAGLGLGLTDPEPELLRQLGLDPDVRGAVVLAVQTNSPAHRAEIRPGQVIISVEGQAVRGARDAARLLRARDPQRPLRLRVMVNGAVQFRAIPPDGNDER